jgi:hypothetical protein
MGVDRELQAAADEAMRRLSERRWQCAGPLKEPRWR